MKITLNTCDKVKVKLTYTGASILNACLYEQQNKAIEQYCYDYYGCDDECESDCFKCNFRLSMAEKLENDIEYQKMLEELSEIKNKYQNNDYYEDELGRLLDIFCGNCFYNKNSYYNLDSYIYNGEFIIEDKDEEIEKLQWKIEELEDKLI